MVLVAVVGLLGFLLTISLQFAADTGHATAYLDGVQKRDKAYYVARAVVEGSGALLVMDDTSVDSLSDTWAKAFPSLTQEGITVAATIKDCDRWFNPLFLLRSAGEVDEDHLRQFERLLRAIAAPPIFADALLDWMDSDRFPRRPGGAERPDYEKAYCKDAPLDSLEEILRIRGCTPEMYYGRPKETPPVPGLSELLTLYSGGKVNINTAPREVLESLDSQVSPSLAYSIISHRASEPFSSVDELKKIPGVDFDLIYRIKKLAQARSEYFQIEARTEEENVRHTLRVILKRSRQGQPRVVYSKME
ncbi:MAG: general secretion pathway protein GspK [Armatimonadetes bacterium]|nr:general secretion pathway protein GspK [Armatimonadota bacterium]